MLSLTLLISFVVATVIETSPSVFVMFLVAGALNYAAGPNTFIKKSLEFFAIYLASLGVSSDEFDVIQIMLCVGLVLDIARGEILIKINLAPTDKILYQVTVNGLSSKTFKTFEGAKAYVKEWTSSRGRLVTQPNPLTWEVKESGLTIKIVPVIFFN